MTIIIDTREQCPWHFPENLAKVKRGTLKTGDYAIEGDENFAIERKSLDDLVKTISSDWKRFERELHRMDWYPVRVVMVECDLQAVVNHEYRSEKVTPKFILGRVSELTMRGVSVIFAGTVPTAIYLAWRILREREKRLKC